MTNEEAAAMLESMKNYFLPTSPMLEERREITALDLAISALSKQCASTEQVGKDIKFPTIHCCRGYDCIKDENGITGFGVYDPKEKNIYIAGDVPKEIFLKALFHEIFHWMQNVAGMKFDEDDANSFSDILYDAVDMFDDRGPELFGQKTIVEPGEVFVGDKVLKEALDDQFREDAKKTDDVSDMNVGKTDFKPGDKFILELGKERRMFGEFEIKGTDLYVRTDLLEKLTRYEPEENATADKILIDLAEAIETVKFECGEWQGLAQTIVNGLKKLSPAQPENNCSEIPNNSDLISRQAAIDAICAVCGNDCDKSEFVYNAPQDEQVILCPEHYCLCNLPSAKPERKTGRWIKTARWGRVYYCDQCRNYLDFDGVNAGRGSTNFCPNCGADMRR